MLPRRTATGQKDRQALSSLEPEKENRSLLKSTPAHPVSWLQPSSAPAQLIIELKLISHDNN
jgi:hypothetical protein